MMDTALHEERLTTGRGTIALIFGEFAYGIATLLLDDGTLLHVHDGQLLQRIQNHFGACANARGRSIIYQADQLKILHECRPL